MNLLRICLLFAATLAYAPPLPPPMTFPVRPAAPPRAIMYAHWTPGIGCEGYKLYYGPSSASYTNSVDVGNVTNANLSLPLGTNFIIATGYDAIQESAPSNEKMVVVMPQTNVLVQVYGVAFDSADTLTGAWTGQTQLLYSITNPVGTMFFKGRNLRIKESRF
jgi:hypothetical protein